MSGHKLFISYSGKDKEIARCFYVLFRYRLNLLASEVRFTMSAASNLSLARKNSTLLKEISSAQLIVYILSPSWHKSAFFQEEIEVGMRLSNHKVIVFKCCGQNYEDIPKAFRDINLVNSDDSDQIKYAMRDAAKVLGIEMNRDELCDDLFKLAETISKQRGVDYSISKGKEDRLDG